MLVCLVGNALFFFFFFPRVFCSWRPGADVPTFCVIS